MCFDLLALCYLCMVCWVWRQAALGSMDCNWVLFSMHVGQLCGASMQMIRTIGLSVWCDVLQMCKMVHMCRLRFIRMQLGCCMASQLPIPGCIAMMLHESQQDPNSVCPRGEGAQK